MAIRIACPACGATYTVGDHFRGKQVRCKSCSRTFTADDGEDDIADVLPADEPTLRRPARPQVDDTVRLPPRRAADAEDEDRPSRGGKRSRESEGVSPALLVGGGVLAGVVVAGGLAVLLLPRKAPAPPDAPNVVVAPAAPQPAVNPPAPANPQPAPAANHDPAAPKPDPAPQGPPRNPRPPRDPAPAPARPLAWHVKPDPLPEESQVATVKPLTLPVGVGNDLLFPATPSPFVAVGRNLTDRDARVVIDLRTGQQVGILRGRLGVTPKVALSPDGQLFATSVLGRGGEIAIYNTRTGQPAGSVQTGATGFIDFVEFAGPARLVTVTGGPGFSKNVTTWDAVAGQKDKEVNVKGIWKAHAVSPGGRYLAGYHDKRVTVIDLDEGKASEVELPDGAPTCHGMAFSPDGTMLAGLFQPIGTGQIVVLDVATGQVTADHKYPQPLDLMISKGATREGHPLEWLPDGSGWLVYGDTVIDRVTGRPRYSVAAAGVELRSGPRRVVAPGQLLALVAGRAGSQAVTIVPLQKVEKAGALAAAAPAPPRPEARPGDLTTARTIQPGAAGGPPEADPLPAMKGTPKLPLAVGGKDATVARVAFTRPDVGQAVVLVAAPPKTSFVARSWRAERFDLVTGQALGGVDGVAQAAQKLGAPELALAAVSPDGKRLVVRDVEDEARLDLWSLADGKHLAAWAPYDDGQDAAPADGGRRGRPARTNPEGRVTWVGLAGADRAWTAEAKGRVALWSLPDCKALAVIQAVPGAAPAFSAGGKYLAVATAAGIDLLDAPTGEPRGRLGLPAGLASLAGAAVAFRPDGKEAAAVLLGTDGVTTRTVVARWELPDGKSAPAFPLEGSPAVTAVEYAGPGFLLLNGSDLLDLAALRVIYRYVGAGAGVPPGPDGRHWFVARGPAGSTLVAKTLPDGAARAAAAQLQSAQPLLPRGTAVSVQVTLTGTAKDLDARRKEVTDSIAARLRAAGLTTDPGGAVKLAVQVQESDTGEFIEYRTIGPGAIGRPGGNIIRVPVKRLTCQATLTGAAGAALWQDRAEFTTRGQHFILHGDPNEVLPRQVWASACGWASGAGAAPTNAVRLNGRVVTLPLTGPLTPGS